MAETTQLSIVLSVDLRNQPYTISVQDNTDYSLINPAYTAIQGILSITSPNTVTFHQNNDYNTPDITLASRTKTGIVVPINSNALPCTGNYVIYYQVLVDGVYHYKTFTLNYQYTRSTGTLTFDPDGYNSRLSCTDGTNYGTYTSLTRTFTVTPPGGSGLPTTVSADSVISYLPNIYSGVWTATLSSAVQYTLTSGIIVYDTITATKTETVYKIDMDALRGYIEEYVIDFEETTNLNHKNQKLYVISKINSYMDLYSFAVIYQDYETAYDNGKKIVDILDPTVTVAEITPFTDPSGGGTPVTDDKWAKTAGVIHPIVYATDTLAIGANAMSGTEKLRVVGSVLASQYNLTNAYNIGLDGSNGIVFTDANGTRTLASIVSFSQPTNWAELIQITSSAANIDSAVTSRHSAITIASGSSTILSLGTGATAQELSISQATSTTSGWLSSTNWNTFNLKQAGHANLTSLSSLTFAAGDLLYATGENALTRLGIGTTGQFLSIIGGVPYWRTASLTPGGSTTQLQFNSSSNFAGTSDMTYTAGTRTTYAYLLSTTQVSIAGTASTVLSGGSYASLAYSTNYIRIATSLTTLNSVARYVSTPTLSNINDLVYKGYVDALFGATYANGIKSSGGVIQLGNTTSSAVGHIDISGTSNIRMRSDSAGSVPYYRKYLDLGYTTSDTTDIGCSYITVSDNETTKIQIIKDQLKIQYTKSSTAADTNIIFNSLGASYNKDLSASNIANDRWIPDKGYVDSLGGGFTDETLTTNQINYVPIGASSYVGFFVEYTMVRGTRFRVGTLQVINDGTTPLVSDLSARTIPDTDEETCGITSIGADISAAFVRLAITVDDSDATDITFSYTVRKAGSTT